MENLNKEYVKSFEDGIAECYPQTELKNAFVVSEVNDIVEPRTMNGSWATGVIFNSTMLVAFFNKLKLLKTGFSCV